MGPKCSTLQMGGNVDISGTGNSAVIINGISYNISSIFNTAINLIMQKYRFELILMHFTSISLVLMSALLIFRCFMPRRAIDKGGTI